MSGPWEDFQQPTTTAPAPAPSAERPPWEDFAPATSPEPSFGTKVKVAAQLAANMGIHPLSPAIHATTWAAQNPQEAYQKEGKWLPAIGGTVGSVAGPFGTAIGAGAGEMARQGLGVYYQDPQVMQHITPGQISPWAGGQAALQTGLAGLNEVNGVVKAAPDAAPYATRAINYVGDKLAPLGNRLVDAGAKVGQMLSGKPAAKIKMLWNDPTAALPEFMGGAKSVETAGQGMEDALKATGIQKKVFNPFEGDDEAASTASATYDKWQAMKNGAAPAAPSAPLPLADIGAAKASEKPVAVFIGNQTFPGEAPIAQYDIYQKGQQLGMRPTLSADKLPAGIEVVGSDARAAGAIPAGGPPGPAPAPTITAQEAYDAKRATDYMFPKVISERNREKIAQMSEFKNAMDDILAKQAGPLQQASQDYSRARLGSDFTQILPRTKTGDISTVKTMFGALLDAKRAAMLPITSPMAVGAATSAASLGSQAVGGLIANPTARQALISRYITGKSSGGGGTNEL